MSGPLTGLRVVELGGIGPAPHAGMVLAGLGADVVRVQRPGPGRLGSWGPADHLLRGMRLLTLDLKSGTGREELLALAARADVLLEGFRPGVAERLGLGPDDCRSVNPRLVYARVTGYGQEGPLAGTAGHDLNYAALSGALHAIGADPAPPPPPLNLVADYGGGSMLLVTGVLAALWERQRSGQGQVLDVAMLDGVSLLLQQFWSLRALGLWSDRRSANLLDGGAPFYATYRCADGGYLAVGALEPEFFAALIDGLSRAGVAPADPMPAQYDPSGWPVLREWLTAAFGARSRDHWAEHFAGTDACVTPVLSWPEVAGHPQIAARGTLVEIDGVIQAAPAPRFSRTAPVTPAAPQVVEGGVAEILAGWPR
ncbi:MAG TPA: CaiB/BaiF CoA-transferase family protein [Kineosporiaceae bacterium]|nr:CaiB/BaiF CoA-transferase family protein [Kineosporiaceae bacterium]